MFCYLASCKDPGIPNPGVRLGSEFQHGKLVTFRCARGYTLIGSKSMVCQKGVWNSSLPQCKSKLTWNEYRVLVVYWLTVSVSLFVSLLLS